MQRDGSETESTEEYGYALSLVHSAGEDYSRVPNVVLQKVYQVDILVFVLGTISTWNFIGTTGTHWYKNIALQQSRHNLMR